MTFCPDDQDDSLRHLLEQALLLPRRHDLLQQQETVRLFLNSVPTRRWLYEAACQASNRNRSIKVRSLIVDCMQYSGNFWREPTVSADDYEEAKSANLFSLMPDGKKSRSIEDIPDWSNLVIESQLFLEQVLELVQRDPDSQLGNCRMQGHPTITCQAIILSILQSQFTSANIPWNELAQTFRIEPNRLRNFCWRTAFPCFIRFCRRHNLMNP